MNMPPLLTQAPEVPDPVDAFAAALADLENAPKLTGLPLNPREPR